MTLRFVMRQGQLFTMDETDQDKVVMHGCEGLSGLSILGW